MIPKLNILTATDLLNIIAKKAKSRRLQLNLKRATLSKRSGISEASLKRFETCGQISLERLLKLAQALSCLDDFETLFPKAEMRSIADLEKLEKAEKIQRGRM
jgi:transcriptional regulator with XRE-family HTH domain